MTSLKQTCNEYLYLNINKCKLAFLRARARFSENQITVLREPDQSTVLRKHLHVLHVLRTYSTCSCPGQQDTTTYAALIPINDWEDQFSLNPNTQKGKHVAQGHFQTLTTTQLQNINHLSVSKSQPNVNLKILKGILHFY